MSNIIQCFPYSRYYGDAIPYKAYLLYYTKGTRKINCDSHKTGRIIIDFVDIYNSLILNMKPCIVPKDNFSHNL